jgi:aryl-alcohol dehydrogenase-like predicted oxidoreductase
MEYRFLGPTGLKVSVLSFGNMNQGDLTKQAEYNEVVKKCWDHGINFFDTSENYNSGTSEIILGEALKNLKVPREELVISTKVFYGKYGAEALMAPNKTPNTWGLSRKHIIEGVKASLKRLQITYADIIFCHRFDHETPLEETCRAFNWLIDNGLTFYWGTSEWTAQQVQGKERKKKSN